jgi:CheY-like chemotaxis protein/HPt (histidine-containing phosphotransfer) domain-containing protein
LQVYLDRNRNRFIFVVSDTGQGLSEEQQLRLFTAFSQGQQSADRRYGGTGLGLYISKQLTEMMGGHIKVTSQLGFGSQFAVYFPWENTEELTILTSQKMADSLLENKPQEEQDVPSLVANILCVDDNEDNLRLVEYLLNKTGAKTKLALNGVEALKIAEEHEFDLILMDMQMPEMDGIEATRQLLEKGYDKPIIMLTANVDSDSKKKIQAVGATEHFGKPIDTVKFYAMLTRFLHNNNATKPLNKTNNSSLNGLQQQYINTFEQKAHDIELALEATDVDELKHLMHKLKGSAGSYGFDLISQLAMQVEDAYEHDDAEKAAMKVQQIIGELRQNIRTY